jgi:hypothetical protein
MQNIEWKTVIGVIQRKTKLIDVQAEKERIRSLIYQAALKSTSSEYLEWKDEVVDVANGLAKLPCDLIRLLKAFDASGHTIKTHRKGEYIQAPYKTGKLRIHYYAMPLVEDSDGEMNPLLYYEFMDWYVWFVIHTYMFDEWMQGNIPSDRWMYIENEYNNAFDQLEEQLYMMRNGIYYDNSML